MKNLFYLSSGGPHGLDHMIRALYLSDLNGSDAGLYSNNADQKIAVIASDSDRYEYANGRIEVRDADNEIRLQPNVNMGVLTGDGNLKLSAWSGGTYITIGDGQINMPVSTLEVGSNIYADCSISTPIFTTGFAGAGFLLGHNNAGEQDSLTVDNLTVRNKMTVYELLINQIRATNGSIWVSDTGKVDSVTVVGNAVTMSFDTGSSASGVGHGFFANDIIRAQRWDAKATSSIVSMLKVDTVINPQKLYGTIYSGTVAPTASFEYVRIGNTSDTTRQGAIYLTSADSNAPYIDVIDGVNSTASFQTPGTIKTRMGKLTGITSAKFGALSGYGFYASGSAYLEGNINATAGEIAGWTITGSKIQASNLILSASGMISASNFSVDTTGTMSAKNAVISGSVYATNAYLSGSVIVSGSIVSSVGNIGGFTLAATKLTGGVLTLSSSGEISSSNFNVSSTGIMTAKSAVLSGSIYATATTAFTPPAIAVSAYAYSSASSATGNG